MADVVEVVIVGAALLSGQIGFITASTNETPLPVAFGYYLLGLIPGIGVLPAVRHRRAQLRRELARDHVAGAAGRD